MNEFKFNCPTCGQHILAAHEWIGRRIDCPSCQSKITIPHPEKVKKQGPSVRSPGKQSPPPTSGATKQTASPAADSKTKSPQTSRSQPAAKVVAKNKADVPASQPKVKVVQKSSLQAEQLRVAVLTPAVKLEMVRAVRRRIEEESNWLPGRINGANAYAAKVSEGETVPVDVTSAEATRYSLVGAFLRELQLRQVVPTAPGRTRLLDQEIPDAVREVLSSEMTDEERGQSEDALTDETLMSISHAQCLAALDLLEQRYSHRMDEVRAEQAKRRLGKVRLPDLVRKLEKKARVAPEDVATALYHEIMEVQRRLERLENRLERDKRGSSDEKE